MLLSACFPKLPPEEGDADGETVDVAAEDGNEDMTQPIDVGLDVRPEDGETASDLGADADSPDCSNLDGPCATGTWRAELGRCVAAFADDETACDDGNSCTDATVCQTGQCVGEAKTCPAPDDCHVAGRCEPTTGQCVELVGPDGVSCTRDDPCTAEAECQSGVCAMTVAAVDEDDWVIPIPSAFQVGFVVPGNEPSHFVFGGSSGSAVSFGGEIHLSPGPLVAVVDAGPGEFARVASRDGPFSVGSFPVPWRPWYSGDGAVLGVVAANASGDNAVLSAMNEVWMSDETVGADMIRNVRVVDARAARFAGVIEHVGCLRWSDVVFATPYEVISHEHCPPDALARSVTIGIGDLTQFEYHEVGLPMVEYRTIISTETSISSPPVVKDARMLPGGAIVLAIEHRAPLEIIGLTAQLPATGGLDCALIYLNREGYPMWGRSVGGPLDERCASIAVSALGEVGLGVETLSPTIVVSGGSVALTIPPRASTPEAGGIAVLVFNGIGGLERFARVHALDVDKPDIRLAGFNLEPTRGGRLLIALEEGQRAAFSPADAKVLTTELGLIWAEFSNEGESAAFVLVDEVSEPRWSDRAETYLGRSSALFDKTGIAGTFQNWAGHWRVVNTNDRLRCRSQ